MKHLILIMISATLLSMASCAVGSRNSTGGEVTGVGTSAWNEPAPYGMVLVSRGSIKAGPQDSDSIWGHDADARGVSVDAFWMDETEVTNSKYKQFVLWVRDSIIRERLADPAYGGNDEYKIEEDRDGNPVTPHLNWAKSIPWRTANEDEQRAIESMY
ncbi:MAG: SUMF1/EgtB/PvdO family nonheme iron enzyme, partial [Muribaculaceae bacterium]|nr:SUMF1/EgtB/PvdO family nonheme iron enzyme [Muribaculaceae bacterium]